MKKFGHLSPCESYLHSPEVSMSEAKKIFQDVCNVYLEREDMYDFQYKSKQFQAKQKMGDEVLLIVVRIDYRWWAPWKGSVVEEAYFLQHAPVQEVENANSSPEKLAFHRVNPRSYDFNS